MSLPPWGRLGRMSPDVSEEARPSGVANGAVAAVARNATHAFSKPPRDEIVLLAGLGVEGDAHAGVTVRHRSRVAADPAQPNVRQVHLIHSELFAEVGAEGFTVEPGHLGENVTVAGLDWDVVRPGARLRIGPALLEVTEYTTPCKTIRGSFSDGHFNRIHESRNSGWSRVYARVLESGEVAQGDPVEIVRSAP